MRFDPDTHRAHTTFESACLARHGDSFGDEPRRVVRPAAPRRWRLHQAHAQAL
jgi:hypothetical protein